MKLGFASSLIAVWSVSVGGFCGPDGGDDPCTLDPTHCGSEPFVWEVVECPGVDASEPLEVELGHGELAFVDVAMGATPVVHFGLQGGQHTFLAFRVGNARLDVYERLRITFWWAQGEACSLPTEALGHPPEGCLVELGLRQLVLGSPRFPLDVDDAGRVEHSGIVMFLRGEPTADVPAVLVVEVEDPCGRVGLEGFAWTP